MAVRTSAPITFTPGQDFFRTDRGVTWGIKVTSVNDIQMVGVFEQAGAAWNSAVVLGDLLTIPQGESVKAWFKRVCLPILNSWLAQRFPASNTPQTPAEELDAFILGNLRVSVAADGTLSARVD